VVLIPSQNVVSNLIQNAALKQVTSENVISAPTNAAPAPIRYVAPALTKHAAPEKATPSLTQHATPEQAVSLISQNLTSIFSQNAVLIASLFKKKVFQSNIQHLIACLVTSSTLSARGIG
jgi:hypothetical protein